MKKTLFIISALALLSALRLLAGVDGPFHYRIDDGKATITELDEGFSGGLVIPDTLGGAPVVAIGDWAFGDQESLTSVTIPASVINISIWAFDWSFALTSLLVHPDNQNYASIDGVLFDKSKATLVRCPPGRSGSYAVPAGVTAVGEQAFYGCIYLGSITFPASIAHVGNMSLGFCQMLTGAFFAGDAPESTGNVFAGTGNITVYRTPGTTGWETAFGGTVTTTEWVQDQSVLNITPSTIVLPQEGGSATFSVTANVGWTATSSAGWILLESGSANGNGTVTVTATSANEGTSARSGIVTVTGGGISRSVTVRQKGTVNDPFIVSPDEDETVTATGSYECFLYEGADEDGGVVEAPQFINGTLSVKVSKLNGKLSAKAQLQSGAISFSAKEWQDAGDGMSKHVSITTKKGEILELFIRQNRIWGSISGGKVGDKLQVVGARNRLADKKDPVAQALLNHYKGYYTMLVTESMVYEEGELQPTPQGAGYLALTVANGGKVKLAGVLADGTKVSRAGILLWFADGADGSDDGFVPLFAPLYSKKGVLGGMLRIDHDGWAVNAGIDEGLAWWFKPGKNFAIDGFSAQVMINGGRYNKSPVMLGGYDLDFYLEDLPAYYAGTLGYFGMSYAPQRFELAVSGKKLVLPKGKAPKKQGNKVDGFWYDYDEDPNPSQATLSFAAATGIFKGKFKVYYDYENDKGALQHKAVSVPYAGIMLQEGGVAVGGAGHCLVPDNEPDAKKYKVKRSMPVWLE